MTAPSVSLVKSLGSKLDDERKGIIDRFRSRIGWHRRRNQISSLYYDGKAEIQKINVALSPEFNAIQTVVGWPGTVVDILEERCGIDYVDVPDSSELADQLNAAWLANDLATEAPMAETSATIHGVTFVVVGQGDDGPLALPVSADRMTGDYDTRRRRLSTAVSIDEVEKGDVRQSTIYTPEKTSICRWNGSYWELADEFANSTGIMPVERLVNRPRLDSNAHWGRSSITPAIRSYTDTAVRTLLSMEVAREFFSMPFRYALNADPAAFQDEDGNDLALFETYWGRFANLVGIDVEHDDGSITTAKPEFGQLGAQSPSGLVEMMKMGSQMISSETGIPPSLLGFVSDQPPSGDAARMYENRLVLRANQRNRSRSAAWARVGRLMLIADGVRPEDIPPVYVRYFDPATLQLTAMSDSMSKVTAGDNPIIPPDSDIVLERLAFSRAEVERIQTDRRRANARATIANVAAAGQAAAQRPNVAAALARSDAARN